MNKDTVAEMSQQYQVEAAEKLVPEGYKQTEVGVIPEDWEAIKMGDLARIQRGASPRPIDNPVWFDINSSVGWLRISDVSKAKKYLTKTVQSLSELGIAHSRFVPENNLVMSICATVGKPVITKKNLCIHDGFVVFNKLNTHQEYMYYVLEELEDEWGKQGQTGSQMNLNTDLINSTHIAVPVKVEEQIVIANALSDTDALLSELGKLIVKKQAIKTATMQQLLTGRTRLPQFAHHSDGSKKGYKQSELGEIPEDWEAKSFGDLFESSVTRKKINPSEIVSFVGMQDVSESAQLVNQSQIQYSSIRSGFTYFEKDDVLVAKITPCFENGKGCHAVNLKTDIGFGSTEFHILRAKILSDSKFIYFWTTRESYRAELETEMVGSAGHRRVPLAALQNYLIPCPSDKQEQTAIATILSDMDEEIQVLEHRLTKTRQIKQGMMQELLTGKTRLVAAQVNK